MSLSSKCASKILVYFLPLLVLSNTEKEVNPRKRRGSFQASYPIGNNLQIGGVDVETYGKPTRITLQNSDIYGDITNIVSVPQYAQHSQTTSIGQVPQIGYPTSNAVDKPVQESQEYIPPQSAGTAIIPLYPPPATPVNAAASNVPSNGNSVFLGSGALGVVDLGGGAYALGSGSIGYSERRSNPRSSFTAPLLPPVQAAPNLIPAAVNNPLPPQQVPVMNYDFTASGSTPPLTVDANGYEYLPPNRVGFGDPLPQRPLKITNSFATPTLLQIQPQLPQIQPQLPPLQPRGLLPRQQQFTPQQSIYGQRISNVYSPQYLR